MNTLLLIRLYEGLTAKLGKETAICLIEYIELKIEEEIEKHRRNS